MEAGARLEARTRWWRTDPDRLLYPLGALLAWAGVLPWLVFAFGRAELYRPLFAGIGWRAAFHPVAQVEGFLTCFAAGLLFTALPRRTGTGSPAAWQVAFAAGAPAATVVCAWFEKWWPANAAWLSLLAVLTAFAARRLRGLRLPASFVWVVWGVLLGAAGSVLAAAGIGLPPQRFWVHLLGRGLLFQGLFTGLVLGTHALLVPEMRPRPARTWAIVLHALAGALFAASFLVEQIASVQLGFALRTAVVLGVVVGPLQGLQPPAERGLRRKLARIALWMLPAGYGWVMVAPELRRAGLHLVFLGCFTALALAIPSQQAAPARARRFVLASTGGLLALALVARVLLELDPPHFHLWLGASSAAFLGATIPWAAGARRT